MHELSIALSIVDIATEEGERLGARVSAVHLKLGALAGIVKEALATSYEVACQDTPLEGSQLIIEDVPVAVFCEHCQEERLVESVQWIGCSVCGTLSPEVRQGKELALVGLEIEQ